MEDLPGNTNAVEAGGYEHARAALRFQRSQQAEPLDPKQAQRLRNLGCALRAMAEELALARREASLLSRENQLLKAQLGEYQ